MTDFALRPFSSADLDAAVALSRQVSWPHRAEDWKMVADLSSGVVATQDGQVVGTAFCTPYGRHHATLNMVVVDVSLRGRGLGRRLMEAVMAAAEGRRLRLTATQDGLPLYRKLGFVEAGEIVQHQGEARALVAPNGAECARAGDADAILALDRAACGADRRDLLQRLLADGETVVFRGGAGLTGFAIRRRFGRGEVIGPVVAPDFDTAMRLIAAQLAARPGAFLRVDTRAETDLGPWLAEQGLAHVGGGVVMTLRGSLSEPTPPSPKTFALASQALG